METRCSRCGRFPRHGGDYASPNITPTSGMQRSSTNPNLFFDSQNNNRLYSISPYQGYSLDLENIISEKPNVLYNSKVYSPEQFENVLYQNISKEIREYIKVLVIESQNRGFLPKYILPQLLVTWTATETNPATNDAIMNDATSLNVYNMFQS